MWHAVTRGTGRICEYRRRGMLSRAGLGRAFKCAASLATDVPSRSRPRHALAGLILADGVDGNVRAAMWSSALQQDWRDAEREPGREDGWEDVRVGGWLGGCEGKWTGEGKCGWEDGKMW
eukprot:110887-Chlamydomonas_euryale.AAC.3